MWLELLCAAWVSAEGSLGSHSLALAALECPISILDPAENRGICIARALVGSFMTALEMAGVSLTLMLVDEELVRLIGEFQVGMWPGIGAHKVSGMSGGGNSWLLGV